MNQEITANKHQSLLRLTNAVLDLLKEGEHLTLYFEDENSLFSRFNQAKVRQISQVQQSALIFTFVLNQRSTSATIPVMEDYEQNIKLARDTLTQCRKECSLLPEDPFVVIPTNNGKSHEDHFENLPSSEKVCDFVLSPVNDLDFVGILTSGSTIRASINSAGQEHWFSSKSFYVDFSLYSSNQKAVKTIYAGKKWDEKEYAGKIQQAKTHLKILEQPEKEMRRGQYRTYLSPSAIAEIITILSWNGVSSSALKQGQCPLAKLEKKELKLSPLFSLYEDFNLGLTPRFNSLGEVSPAKIPVIVNGELENFLTNTRTAQEYGIPSNKAETNEQLRSPVVSPGNLKEKDILKHLDTGLYVSNLHYLNWSDIQTGRITGMTRYACFWVEGGKIVSPIRDLRFDDNVYNFLGKNLKAVTEFNDLIPNTSTYFNRGMGGTSAPGLLIDDFTYTL